MISRATRILALLVAVRDFEFDSQVAGLDCTSALAIWRGRHYHPSPLPAASKLLAVEAASSMSRRYRSFASVAWVSTRADFPS
jgi:hypothetical protein